jgi:hypothetical protein
MPEELEGNTTTGKEDGASSAAIPTIHGTSIRSRIIDDDKWSSPVFGKFICTHLKLGYPTCVYSLY